jgi:hypothetical protein
MVASRSPAPVNALSTAFRNEIFDPKPLTRSAAPAETASQPPVARPVRTTTEIAARRPNPPVAAPRPPVYGVASAQAAPAPRPAAEQQAASFDSRFGPALATAAAPMRSAPVSAYAPQPNSTGVLTGRGLY